MSDQVLSAPEHFLPAGNGWRGQTRPAPVRVGGGLAFPCQLGEPADGRVAWRPYHRPEPADFTAMADALELTIHPSAIALFGHWFSRPIPCLFKGCALN